MADDVDLPENGEEPPATAKAKSSAGKSKAKRGRKRTGGRRKTAGKAKAGTGRTRNLRPYPAASFEDALPLGQAIQTFASGEKVRRLTLLGKMNKSPSSSATRLLITHSSRYGITVGSYAAEWLELTELGAIVTAPDTAPRARLEASFKLAIEGIEIFNYLYEQYRGKKLPSHEVMKDVVRESNLAVEDEQECIDLFIVNAKYLGLLQTLAGAETLLPLDHILDDAGKGGEQEPPVVKKGGLDAPKAPASGGRVPWSKICFYISPIGDEGTEIRKHADLFLGSLVEPALKDFGLEVVRADRIGEPGMITSQVIEHIMRARLVIVDMSYHNPNVFYEMALRHACKLPIVQITRKQDKLPFDINQMRTVVIDTTDIYTLVPKLETLRSEIATYVRTAISDDEAAMTPISVFFPGFSVTIPKEKAA
jgi:hypothetical protein